jgi:hypothetical protein
MKRDDTGKRVLDRVRMDSFALVPAWHFDEPRLYQA